MKTVTVEEINSRINAGEKLNLVDVRESFEHEEFNIGGILLPIGEIMEEQIELIENLKNKEVILYCRSGNRSAQAALILERAGFTDIANLTGGMLSWQEKF